MNGPTRRALALALVVCLPAVLAGCGCDNDAGDSADAGPGNGKPATAGEVPRFELTPELVKRHNHGVALMERYKYEGARTVFQELVDEHPGWHDARVNLANAALNDEQTGAVAIPILEQVLAAKPDHLEANYLLGVSLLHLSKMKEARKYFEKTIELDPGGHDPFPPHLLAQCIEQTTEDLDRALELFLESIRRDEYFASSRYRAWDLLKQRRAGVQGQMAEIEKSARKALSEKDRAAFRDEKARLAILEKNVPGAISSKELARYRELLSRRDELFDKGEPHLQAFLRLKDHPLSRLWKVQYTQMGPKADIIRVTLEPSRPARPAGAVFTDPQPLPAGGSPGTPTSITTCDIDGDGEADLFLAGARPGETGGGNAVLLGSVGGSWKRADDHPLAAVSGVNAALWGDIDNDGLIDVYLCRRGPNQLWRQIKANQWENVTAATKTAGGDADTIDGVLLDLDHDADLDLLLIHRDAAPELLNNNRDGTFQSIGQKTGVSNGGRPARAVVVADLDADRDLDIVLIATEAPHRVLFNDREWRYHAAEGFDELAAAPIWAAVAADVNADGQPELYTVGLDGLARWQRSFGGNWHSRELDPTVGNDSATRLALLDVTGDGVPELLAGNAAWRAFTLRLKPAGGRGRRAGTGESRDVALSEDDLRGWRGMTFDGIEPLCDSGDVSLAAWAPLLLDPVRGPAIVAVAEAGNPVAWHPGTGRHPFLAVALTGSPRTIKNRERSNVSGFGATITVRVGSRKLCTNTLRRFSGSGQSHQPAALGLGGADTSEFTMIVWSEGVTQSEMSLKAGVRHQVSELDLLETSCPVLFAWDGEKYRFVSDLLAVGGLGYLVAPGEYAPADPTENFLLPPGLARPADGRYRFKLTEPMPELTYLDRVGLTAWDLPPGWAMTLDERLATGSPEPTGRAVFFRTSVSPSRVINDRGQDVTDTVRRADHIAAPVGPLDRRYLGRLVGEHTLTLEFLEPLDTGPGRPVLVADGWVEFPYSQTAFSAWQAAASFDPPTLEARDAGGNWRTVCSRFGYPGGMPRQMSVPLENLPPGTTAIRLRTNLEIYWDRLRVVRAEPCPDARRWPLKLVLARMSECGFINRQFGNQFRPFFEYADRERRPWIPDPDGLYTRLGPVEELVENADDALAIFGPGEEVHVEFTAPAERPADGWTRRLVLETVGWCKDMDLFTGDGSTVEPLPTTGKPADLRDRLHRRYNTRYQDGRSR